MPHTTGLEVLADVGRVCDRHMIIIEQVLVSLADCWLGHVRLYQAWLQASIEFVEFSP